MVIADLLRLDLDDTTNLTEVIYKRTHGNIFFTKQLLEDLRQKGVLSVSMYNYKWTWDIENVEAVAVLSDNVVHVVTAAIST